VTSALYPFSPGVNPYQTHVADSLQRAGVSVQRLLPRRRAPHRAIADSTSDIVHMDWLTDLYSGRSWPAAVYKASTYAVFLRLLRDRLAVYTVHNLEAHEPLRSVRSERSNLRALIGRLDGLVHLSAHTCESFVDLYPSSSALPTVTLMHGHYCDDYPQGVTSAVARDRLGIAREARVALCFGLMRPYKGLVEFAELFVAGALADDVLVVAGPPHDSVVVAGLRAVAHRSGGKIRVHDRSIPAEEVQVFMAAADVGIMPARRVTNSASAILYLSFGLPVMTYAVGSLPGILPADRSLLIADFEDPSIVRAGLEMGERHRDRRLVNIERTRNEYSWDVFGERLAGFYRELLVANE
jgi:beta-1,4-mannosyltransferase